MAHASSASAFEGCEVLRVMEVARNLEIALRNRPPNFFMFLQVLRAFCLFLLECGGSGVG